MMSYRIQGGAQLASALRGMALKDERSAIVALLKTAGEPIREDAERLVPVSEDAPHIVDHIVISATNELEDGEKSSGDEHAVAIGPVRSFFYSIFLEFGTVKMRAQPFMRPAFDTRVMDALKALQEGIWSLLRKRASTSTTGRGL